VGVVDRIDAEFDRDEGFIGRLRDGRFDPEGARRLLSALNELPTGMESFDRRLVSLLWYLPLVIGWQEDRVSPADRDKVRDILGAVIARLEAVLGVP
jgi:hypothetical protein